MAEQSTAALPQRVTRRLEAVPLSVRLLAILLATVLAALTISGVGSVAILRGYLVGRLDDQLGQAADTVAARLGGGRAGMPRPNQLGPLPSSYVVQVTSADGTSADRYLNPVQSGTRGPAIPRLTLAQATQRQEQAFTVHGDGEAGHWRVVVRPLPDESGSIAVALPLDQVAETVSRLTAIVLLGGLLVLAASAALGWIAVRRAFRPLAEVEQVAEAIADGDLSRRVPERPTSTEVGRLAAALNTMLAQIEQAFGARAASEARMRRFVADASHELRTPLATVRGYAELYRQGAVSDPEAVAGAMRRIEDEARRMGLMVEDLLVLARLDEQRPAARDDVDLTVLVADAAQDARALAPDRDVRVEGIDGPIGPTVLRGDEGRLRQVVTNLVANALHHTPAGTPIELAVGRRTVDGRETAEIEVRDHGPGLAPEEAHRVFERFYRADPSRGRETGGSGLGLAIVAAIVTAHQGQVGVRATPGGGATFVVRLPFSQQAPSIDPAPAEVGGI